MKVKIIRNGFNEIWVGQLVKGNKDQGAAFKALIGLHNVDDFSFFVPFDANDGVQSSSGSKVVFT